MLFAEALFIRLTQRSLPTSRPDNGDSEDHRAMLLLVAMLHWTPLRVESGQFLGVALTLAADDSEPEEGGAKKDGVSELGRRRSS